MVNKGFEKKVIIALRNTGELIEVDYESQRKKYLGGYEKNCPLYTCSCEFEKKVFFFPYYGQKLKVLDLQKNIIEYHDLIFEEKDIEILAACSCIVCENLIYVFSWNQAAKAMVIIDPKTYEASSYCIKSKDIEVYPNSYIANCIVGDDIWISANEKGTLIQYKTKSQEFIVHRISGCNEIIRTVNFDGNFFWITGEMDSIVRWNQKNNEAIEISKWPKGFVRNGNKTPWKGMFYVGYYHDNKILYVPLEANQFLELNCSDSSIETVLTIENNEYCYGSDELPQNSYFVEIKQGTDQSLVCGYMIDEHVEFHKIAIFDSIDNSDEIFECRRENDSQCLMEDSFVKLKEYIHFLSK